MSTQFTVGQELTKDEVMQLPVGAELSNEPTHTPGGNRFRVYDGGLERLHPLPTKEPWEKWRHTGWVLESLPTMKVGDRLTTFEQFDAAPVGTVVQVRGYSTVRTKQPDETWRSESNIKEGTPGATSKALAARCSRTGYYKVLEVGGTRPVPEFTGTLRQVRHKVRTVLLSAAESIAPDEGREEAKAEVRRLLPVETVPSLSMYVGQLDFDLISQLPDGTLVGTWQGSLLQTWQVHGNRLARVQGTVNIAPHQPLQVMAVPGPVLTDNWALEQPETDEELAEEARKVRDLLLLVWDRGSEMCAEYGWCAEFGTVMRSLGVTAEWLATQRPQPEPLIQSVGVSVEVTGYTDVRLDETEAGSRVCANEAVSITSIMPARVRWEHTLYSAIDAPDGTCVCEQVTTQWVTEQLKQRGFNFDGVRIVSKGCDNTLPF